MSEFIDSLKFSIDQTHWNAILSKNKELRVTIFKVFKESYKHGLISYTTATEVFMVYLNDTLTEYDHLSGLTLADEALKILTEISKKDAKVILKQDFYTVSQYAKPNHALDFWKKWHGAETNVMQK